MFSLFSKSRGFLDRSFAFCGTRSRCSRSEVEIKDRSEDANLKPRTYWHLR